MRYRSCGSWARTTASGSCVWARRAIASSGPTPRRPRGCASTSRGFGVVLQPGQKAEIAPDSAALHRTLARALGRGSLVAFDYGHPARILYHPFARPEGTLAVHMGGRRGGDPLEDPGERDLTAHVNWDALLAAGEAEGLRAERLMRQGMFLTEIGILDFAGSDAEKWRIFRLIDPEGMGEELSVLVQRKGVAAGGARD